MPESLMRLSPQRPDCLREAGGSPFTVSPAALVWKGTGLVRPECVLTTAAGDLFAADWRGGVAHIRPGGSQVLYAGSLPGGRPLRPNGIALRRGGTFLLADLGETQGGVFELGRDGSVRPYLEEVDGIELPPSNFVAEDRFGRTWVTVSTRLRPRTRAHRADVADGFIVLADERGARIVADGLGYTNEAVVSPDGAWLYVNETFGRRLVRFPIAADGALGARESVAVFGKGTFPDGLAFDAAGGVWVTSIVSNRVIRVGPDGAQQLVLEDADEAHVDWCEQAFAAGEMGRVHMDACGGRFLKNISSLAFGGADLQTAYLGCLKGNSIAAFRSPVAGHPPVHWRY
ncbi:MAG: SMP-30/gluconolactonase/LRE family protein [Desulfobacterales bacterium]|nr:SMP-30/gluconolactonase/LRE family protein [Desulfobacterales bacterium]